jgi:hypothetical protein
MRIDEAGLHADSEISEGTVRWAAYNGFRETQNLFLLDLGPRAFHALPKRAFSGEQMGEFRRLADANLPSSKRDRSERIEHDTSS